MLSGAGCSFIWACSDVNALHQNLQPWPFCVLIAAVLRFGLSFSVAGDSKQYSHALRLTHCFLPSPLWFVHFYFVVAKGGNQGLSFTVSTLPLGCGPMSCPFSNYLVSTAVVLLSTPGLCCYLLNYLHTFQPPTACQQGYLTTGELCRCPGFQVLSSPPLPWKTSSSSPNRTIPLYHFCGACLCQMVPCHESQRANTGSWSFELSVSLIPFPSHLSSGARASAPTGPQTVELGCM